MTNFYQKIFRLATAFVEIHFGVALVRFGIHGPVNVIRNSSRLMLKIMSLILETFPLFECFEIL